MNDLIVPSSRYDLAEVAMVTSEVFTLYKGSCNALRVLKFLRGASCSRLLRVAVSTERTDNLLKKRDIINNREFQARLRYKKLSQKPVDSTSTEHLIKEKKQISMFRKRSLSFSKKRTTSVTTPEAERKRANSEEGNFPEPAFTQPAFTRSHNERKSFRRFKEFIGVSKDNSISRKESLKSKISGPIPVTVKRYGVDNTDYITGLPAVPNSKLKQDFEEDVKGFYNSLPRPKKSTPEKVAIISGRTGSFSSGPLTRSGSLCSSNSSVYSTLRRNMSSHRRLPPVTQEEKHTSVSSEESGVSVSYDTEQPDSMKLEKCKWYHGIVKPTHADKVLKKNGDFLVRENVQNSPLYFVSIKWQDTIQHFPIKSTETFPGAGKMGYKYSFEDGSYDNVPQLITAHLKYKIPINHESGAIIMNPVNKGSDYEDIDKAAELQQDSKQQPADTSEDVAKLNDRNIRSKSVPTTSISTIEKKAVTRTPSPALLMRKKVQKEDDDTYMEMSSVKSLHDCPPDCPCDNTSVQGYSSTPEPTSRSSTPLHFASMSDIPKSRIQSTPKKNRSSPLYRTISPQVDLAPPSYDLTCTIGKSGTGLPREASLQKIVSKVLDNSVDQLSFHITFSDAVCFQILPRPGELEEVWWGRMKAEGAMNGLLSGLEVLGCPQGQPLWDRLWRRHYILNQWVVLCLTSMQSLNTRVALLNKLIQVARSLQGIGFADIFGFMALMSGLLAQQVTSLRRTWKELEVRHPDIHECFSNQLMNIYTQLQSGARVFAPEFVSIPSIQHLGEAFLPNTKSFESSGSSDDVQEMMEGLDRFARSLLSLREMLQHCPTFHWNTKKKLSGTMIDLHLYDFFMRDHTWEMLAQMNLELNLQDANNRKRLFNHLLEILSENAEPQLIISS